MYAYYSVSWYRLINVTMVGHGKIPSVNTDGLDKDAADANWAS